MYYPASTTHLYNIYTMLDEDVGPTLYKCYTNVLCLLGICINCSQWCASSGKAESYDGKLHLINHLRFLRLKVGYIA